MDGLTIFKIIVPVAIAVYGFYLGYKHGIFWGLLHRSKKVGKKK